ncbi:MaoC family dehydratase [Glaciibacter superstes]|uniref:MaoC family dehydratase n=1 Tax=Glaciibacter superstes TaxID=501023 RepID=UPI0003B6CF0A|nr:MaoC family dehydratase [Glaciibacter superstes]
MRVIEGLDQLAALVGQELGVSDWLDIDQARIDLFADATGDHQWIHTEPIRAASGPYGKTIAHGYLTLALLPLLSERVYRVDGLAMVLNYGLDKVRFLAPVLVGSRVRNRPVLISMTSGPAGTRVIVQHTVELEGSDRPACVAEQIRLMVP